MNDSTSGNVRDFDRLNLRLPAATFAAIDRATPSRAGHVSRNTWLTEAVAEKRARDATNDTSAEDRRHG